MIDERFVFLGIAIGLYGSVRYGVETIRGHTAPNRVSWFFWALAPVIGFAAQLDEGVGLSSLYTLSVGVGPAFVFASCFFNPRAYWRISRFDIACGLISVVALVLWQTVGSPTLAVVFSVLADLAAGVPTIIKAYRAPGSEHVSAFRNAGINAGITMLSIDHWTVATWAFPVYIAALSVVLTALVGFRVGDRIRAARGSGATA